MALRPAAASPLELTRRSFKAAGSVAIRVTNYRDIDAARALAEQIAKGAT